MTTVKLPKEEQQQPSSILKVIFLLVAVLGAAFLLFKHDPYTTAVLEKSAESPSSSLRQRRDDTAVDISTKATAISGGGGSDGSRTFVIDLASLKEGKTGQIVVKTHPEWAPLGAARYHELMDMGFYNNLRIFRVVNNFMVQFGIQAVPKHFPIAKVSFKDDPVETTNAYGTVTFATSGKDSRTTQIFINTNKKGNAFLDKQGFSPFAEVISGMEFVEQIYSDYGEKPNQGKVQSKGNEYLQAEFPNLSYIASTKSADSTTS